MSQIEALLLTLQIFCTVFTNARIVLCSNILLWLTTLIFCNPSVNYKIENIQSTDGLINNHVLCSFQDSRGLVWIGTYSGVQSFDGSQLDLFNKNEKGKNLFTNHVILAIAEDKKNNLWFGTEFGLNKYNYITGEIKQFLQSKNADTSLNNNCIKDIVIDNEGIIWLGTYGGGITAFSEETNTFESYQVTPDDSLSLQSNLINSLYIDNSGLLWVATENGGVSVFDREKRKVIQNFSTKTNGFEGKIVNCVYQDYYGNYWFGTWNNGLIKYSVNTKTFKNFKSFSNNSNKKNTTVRSITQIDKDFLWIATFEDGLYKLDINNEAFFKVELQTPNVKNTKQDYIWNILKDNNDNLWISTFGSGIFMVNTNKNTFPSYRIIDNNNSSVSISCFLEDERNQIWIGTYTSGIFIYDQKTKKYKKFNLIPNLNARINNLYMDSKNTIWVGTNNALFQIFPDRQTYKTYKHIEDSPESLTLSGINSILEDNNGNMWFGLWGGGINILKSDQLKIPDAKKVVFEKYNNTQKGNTISNNQIWKLFKDSRGNIWIASPDKLTYYNPNDKTFRSLEIYAVSSLYETESGTIWVTSMEDGLILIDKDHNILKTYNKEDGFPSNALSGLLADKKGRLWVGTNKGIAFVDPENGIVSNFNKNQGVNFLEANANASLILHSGEIVYGGNEGFNIFTPETFGVETFDGKIYINKIKALYETNNSIVDTAYTAYHSFNIKDSLYLNHKNKVITIEFSAIDFSNPKDVIYAYCLEGFDPDWIITDSKNKQAVYSNLPPGKYLFKVKASYNAKNWGVHQASVLIEIKKPFHKTTGFLTLVSLTILIIITLLIRYKYINDKKSLIKQNEQLKNEKLEQEKELLRLQNIELNHSIIKNKEHMASLAFKNLNSIEKMETIYRNLKEIEENTALDHKQVVRNTIKLFEQDSVEVPEEDTTFKTSVNLAYDNFQKKLSVSFPKLTHKDLRICSYIRMNKSNKEIAQQLNITIGSLETSRYRIRKKIGLESNINLNDFLIKF